MYAVPVVNFAKMHKLVFEISYRNWLHTDIQKRIRNQPPSHAYTL